MINLKRCTLVCFTFFILYSFKIFSQESGTSIRSLSCKVEKYGLFETELVSDSTYDNPYVEVSLSAHVSGPEGIAFDVEGYWFGGNLWRLRIMPTAAGHWNFITSSNDPDFDSLIVTYDCIPSSRPGILIVNPDYPYTFKLSEGGPFFWMGETSWCLMSNAVPYINGIFQEYITKRLEQKFKGIHFVLGTGGMPYNTKNPANEGGNLWISQQEQRINPDFFKWMDKKIAYLDSVQMAIGFFITWAQHFATFTREEFDRFERYLIARYAAYPLLYWVIVGEFDEAGTIDDYNYHGQVINERDPYGHLISNHPSHRDPNNLGTSRIFADQQWFGFVTQQLPQFPVWISHVEVYQNVLEDRIYKIPVVNAEFGYENKDYYGKLLTSDWVRKYAWSVMCGGGFFSYGNDATIRKVNLNALESEGILYMGFLFDFFQKTNWWEMNPDTNKADYGYCLSSPSNEYLIYSPDSGTIHIDFTKDLGRFCAQWYNPKNGTLEDTLEFIGGNVQSFTSIYENDAVLHIWQSSSPDGYHLSGTVNYYHEQRPVSYSLLNLRKNEQNLNDTTDVNGAYDFKNIIEDQVELVPSKEGDLRNAIKGADALMVLQHLALKRELTDDQKFAADVTEDGQVTSSDARSIMCYLAFLTDHIGSTGQWRFIPDTAKFWLHADTTVSFRAFLLGDVNGSWNQGGIVNGSGNESDTSEVYLRIAELNVSVGKQFSIPITIDRLDKPLETLIVSVKYNPEILKFISAEKTILSEKFNWVSNSNERGKVHCVMVGINGLQQPGEIIKLAFEIVDPSVRYRNVDLEISNAWINDLKVTRFKNGRVNIGKRKTVDTKEHFRPIQNYPNPFNPVTNISFNLSYDAKIKIDIFNIVGQKVCTILDDELSAGIHEISWFGENEIGEPLPSGIYFYQINVEENDTENGKSYRVMKKMSLLK
jgi:hypothetical protein